MLLQVLNPLMHMSLKFFKYYFSTNFHIDMLLILQAVSYNNDRAIIDISEVHTLWTVVA